MTTFADSRSATDVSEKNDCLFRKVAVKFSL